MAGIDDMLGGIAATNLQVVGAAPSAAMSMTYLAMADSISLVMQNAAAMQQRMQLLFTAATGQVLKQIVKAGTSGGGSQ